MKKNKKKIKTGNTDQSSCIDSCSTKFLDDSYNNLCDISVSRPDDFILHKRILIEHTIYFFCLHFLARKGQNANI